MKRQSSRHPGEVFPWFDYLNGATHPTHEWALLVAMQIRSSFALPACLYSCRQVHVPCCRYDCIPSLTSLTELASGGFQYRLKTNGSPRILRPSAPDLDCWDMQPQGLSDYQSLSITCVKAPAVGVPWRYNVIQSNKCPFNIYSVG